MKSIGQGKLVAQHINFNTKNFEIASNYFSHKTLSNANRNLHLSKSSRLFFFGILVVISFNLVLYPPFAEFRSN